MNTRLDYAGVNESPAPTWSWLRLNRAPLAADVAAAVPTMRVSGADGAEIAFDADTFARYEKDFFASAQTDTSADAKDLLSRFDAETLAVTAKGTVSRPVAVHHVAADGTSSAAKHIVRAEEGAEITVLVDYASAAEAGGFQAVRTLLHAKARAKIHLVKVQLLGAGFTQVDGTVALAEEGAEIRVTQVALGGLRAFIDTTCTLGGFQSKCGSDTAYYCRGGQTLDMNYAVLHRGARTDTQMSVRGVVDGTATKIYRGTIDFRRGCAGATGSEQEETLLLSPNAVNKSIPVMLCDEEDVSGSHGATIGRLGADELFYMQSRGISEEAAKAMMSRAKIAGIARRIPDPALVAEIEAFLDRADADKTRALCSYPHRKN